MKFMKKLLKGFSVVAIKQIGQQAEAGRLSSDSADSTDLPNLSYPPNRKLNFAFDRRTPSFIRKQNDPNQVFQDYRFCPAALPWQSIAGLLSLYPVE
jgi:hypothetical protein